jgi:alpha-N-acetylglucosaminidase
MRQWQEEIDRMAMWGINMPLAFVGQEWVSLQFYLSLGLNETEITAQWMSGPCVYAWAGIV